MVHTECELRQQQFHVYNFIQSLKSHMFLPSNCVLVMIIIIKIFLKRKILSLQTILTLSARAHTHTHRGTCTQAFRLYKAKYTQLKTGSKYPGDWEWIKTHSAEQKTWQVYNFVKRNVFRLDLNELSLCYHKH